MWKMDPNEALLSRGTTEGFIDRSKVRILLCDIDINSSQEVFNLLCKCSYQVTSVRSPRQVIDALNAEGPDIDIILSEVDLPMTKGFKMLKYIMRDKDLQRIPVIMMSAQDEVALVVKCLRLGAADYLVKPLRTNELLNLWTHMWRRRRMLGLAEKNIMNCEFDVVPSDPSDANTNSTTLFSDDTDDKSHKSSNPEISVSIHLEDESNVIRDPGLVNTLHVNLSDDLPNVPEINEQQRAVYPGKIMLGPKKSELRIGQSSAFLTYVKSSIVTSATHEGSVYMDEPTPPLVDNNLSLGGEQLDNMTINRTDENVTDYVHVEEKVLPWGEHMISNTQGHDFSLARENFYSNNSLPDSLSVDTSSTPTLPPESSQQNPLPPEFSQPMNPQQLGHNYHPDVSGYNPYSAYPYYLPGPANHVMMSSIYQQHMSVPHCLPHHMPGMASFPYYPVNLCLPGQMPPGMHPWPSYGSSSNDNVKVVSKLDRREAALLKFRQKKKERCFDKKIRYINRKKLAERRPRVRGQFVRKLNGINVDLNGQPTSTDFDEDDDDDDNDEEEDQAGRDSSPENDYATFRV